MFELLDDYHSTVYTAVAEPALASADADADARTDIADGTDAAFDAEPEIAQGWDLRRWPPCDAPWNPRSVLDAHCDWLADHVPAAYIQRYAAAHGGALPSLGHLHFVYNASGPHGPWSHVLDVDAGAEDAAVCCPSDLCVCDCPLIEATGAVPAVEGSVRLLARCVAVAGAWPDAASDAAAAAALAAVRGPVDLAARARGALDDPPDAAAVAWMRALRCVAGADADLGPVTVALAYLATKAP